MVEITETTIRAEFLDPALDSISLNQEQQRLLLNATPEIDSAAEWLISLRQYGVPGEVLRHGLTTFIQPLIDLNRAEGDFTRRVSQAADRMARDAVGGEPTIKELACELRLPLKRIAAHKAGEPGAYPAASYATVTRLIDRENRARLVGSTMLVQLGKGPYGLLLEMVGRHDDTASVTP